MDYKQFNSEVKALDKVYFKDVIETPTTDENYEQLSFVIEEAYRIVSEANDRNEIINSLEIAKAILAIEKDDARRLEVIKQQHEGGRM